MHTAQLKNEIHRQLSSLIDRDYCLLLVPIHNNVGDNAIWQGELDFLSSLKGVHQKYSCSTRFFDPKKIGPDDIILFQGGGHFGDLYKHAQEFKNRIVERFKNNRIIIFPNSVHFNDQAYLKETVRIFDSHSDVTICARDRGAYEFLKANFQKNNILLVPDMAFFIDLSEPKPTIQNKRGGEMKVLYLERNDRELKINPDFRFPKNFTSTGWCHSGEGSVFVDMRNLISKQIGKGFRLLNIKYDTVYGPLNFARRHRADYIKAGLDFLRGYDLVITQRLHGHILSTMLGIPNILLDISYGKNRDFYSTWTHNCPHAYFAKDTDELKQILKSKFNINV